MQKFKLRQVLVVMIKSSSEFLLDRTGAANSFDYVICGRGSSSPGFRNASMLGF
jgi:hypothetical protein